LKVFLVYPRYIADEQPLGLLYVAGMLNKSGHRTDLFHLSHWTLEKRYGVHFRYRKELLRRIRSFKPDVIGFSVCTTEYPLSLGLARLIKKHFDIPIVFGGFHPTVNPEETLREECVDVVCRGEGEEAMLELVTRIESGKDFTDVKNMWVKKDGNIYANTVRPLVQDLDSLPYPARELIPARYLVGKTASFIAGRGCPYACTYCTNSYMRNLYGGQRYVRFRKSEAIISEIKHVVAQFKIRRIIFADDTFTLNRDRTMKFLTMYEREIGLPFQCNSRVDTADREVLQALKNANCDLICFGIESGNAFIRKNVLRRVMTNGQIARTFALAHSVGLRTSSFNMVGIPYETESNIWDTIKVNRQVQPDHTHCTILMPYKGTEINKLCNDNGWLKTGAEASSYYSSVATSFPDMPPRLISAYATLFPLLVKRESDDGGQLAFLRFMLRHTPTRFHGMVRHLIEKGVIA
jgi:anaerobic magnesium-protoporphyrin IX monomethyl ester cyclase